MKKIIALVSCFVLSVSGVKLLNKGNIIPTNKYIVNQIDPTIPTNIKYSVTQSPISTVTQIPISTVTQIPTSTVTQIPISSSQIYYPYQQYGYANPYYTNNLVGQVGVVYPTTTTTSVITQEPMKISPANNIKYVGTGNGNVKIIS